MSIVVQMASLGNQCTTYSVVLVSIEVDGFSHLIAHYPMVLPRTLVYHWRCLLTSQIEVIVATAVKKPVASHPTYNKL